MGENASSTEYRNERINMSLDVMLSGEPTIENCFCPNCCNQHTKEVREEIYSSNITHNLGDMAEAAGIYKELWRPEVIGITKAKQLIEPLKIGLEKLKSDPKEYERYNASNGWGLYEHFVPFVENYLNACIENPDANVSVSR
jgi:hypothetical protein